MDHDPIDHAIELCNTISFKLGRIAEITNHGDEEKEETFANYGPKGDAGPNKAVKAKKVKQTIKKIT